MIDSNTLIGISDRSFGIVSQSQPEGLFATDHLAGLHLCVRVSGLGDKCPGLRVSYNSVSGVADIAIIGPAHKSIESPI